MSNSRDLRFRMARGAVTLRWRRLALAFLIAWGLAASWLSTALAQVVVLVNGEPITALDIALRTKLDEISIHKVPTRQEAIDELIDEKLKLQIAKHYVLDITPKDVDGAFDGMAHRAGVTVEQFTQALTQAGVSIAALKNRVKADIGWSAIIRGKFQPSLQVGDKDVRDALQQRKKDDKPSISYLYTLRQVLFIAPRGVPDSLLDARRHEAEGLRSRFQSCDEGIPVAQAMKDVTVRNPINRVSAEVPAKQREVLDATPLGQLTPPEITTLGVEMFAVCGRQETHGDSPDEHEMRDQITNERYEAQSKRYLEELRRSAMIEVR